MNVNRRLIELTADKLYKYDCLAAEFEEVLLGEMSFEQRQERAIRFIDGVLTRHGKERLRSQVAELAKVEHGIRELQPKQRDHVVHVVRVFLLGIFFNENLLRDKPASPLEWKLAGLTHDVGYPLEIASNVAKPYGDKLNDIAAELQASASKVTYRAPRLEGIENLTGGRNGLQLIQDRLNEWGIAIDAMEMYRERTQGSSVCHGVISALSVLWVLDLLFARWNPEKKYESVTRDDDNIDWNQTWFDNQNVSACAAIFLHNLDPRLCEKTPIDRHRAPVAFLLRLADTLQEWDRPSAKNPEGLPAELFDLEATSAGITYQANVEIETRRHLQAVLDATLMDHRIRIEPTD